MRVTEEAPTRSVVADTGPKTAGAFWISYAFMALALVYAFLAGFHTTDFDSGWHLATGRWVLQHHSVFTTDQFSYTARGARWIYPPLPGVIFYVLYSIAGWSALSWLTALACVAAVALTLRRDEPITNALAIIAVPAIAFRTVARADLFNTVLFAAMLRVVWSYYRGRSTRLWLIPVLMMLWANLHLGFVAGLGMLLGYVAMEVLALPVGGNLQRLRRAWPWLLAGAAATFINPFGWRVYQGVADQPLVSKGWNYLVGEFAPTPFSTARQALDWRDPQGAYWWLMAIAAVAVVVCIARKQFGPALLLAAAMWESLSRIRFQAMFAIVAVVVAGDVLSSTEYRVPSTETKRAVAAAAACLLVLFVGIRSFDLITDRYYVRAGEIAQFGAGAPWWYPERAAEFVEREHLPGNIFSDFNVGAYLSWRLPQYPVYTDNRAILFGIPLLFHQRALMQQSPDSPAWQRDADVRGINTIFLSAARYGGLQFPLPDYCASKTWTPVYMDDVAVVLVRNRPENAEVTQRLRIDCKTVPLQPNAASSGRRGRTDQFQYLSNAAAIEFLLERDADALDSLNKAEQIYPYDAGVHLSKGQLFQAEGKLPEAERQYRTALRLKESSAAWYALGLLLEQEKRWSEAVPAVERAAKLDVYPHATWLHLGEMYLATRQPQQALDAFEKARKSDPFVGDASQFGAAFHAQLSQDVVRAEAVSRSKDH